MREMPTWAQTLVAKPALDAMVEVFADPDAGAAEDQMFRVQLLHAYANVRHADPSTLDDPLLRLLVRLSDENTYDMNLDGITWVTLFSVLRDHSPYEFAAWINQNRGEFWLDTEMPDIDPWVYRNPEGTDADRFPHLSDALANLSASARTATESAGLSPQGTGPAKQGSGCYIATAVYGSHDATPVITLRNYRDRTLAQSAVGRAFISFYYVASPPVAQRLEEANLLNRAVRSVLDRIVTKLEERGYAAADEESCAYVCVPSASEL